MYELVDTKKNFEIVANKTLQDNAFRKIYGEKEYEKVKNFYKELKELKCDSTQKIRIFDLEDRILIDIVNDELVKELESYKGNE